MALDFQNDSLSRASSLPAWNAFTACGWARRSSDSGTYAALFDLASAATSAGSYLGLAASANGDDLKAYSSAGGFAESTTLATLVNGTNFFWAITNDGTTIRAYYAAAGAAALSTVTLTSQPSSFTSASMLIGNDSYAEPFFGAIGRLKIWDAVLTSGELEIERHFALPKRTANLHIWSPLGRTDSEVTDFSGNGRNWTANGTIPLAADFPIAFSPSRRRIIQPVVAAGAPAFTQRSVMVAFA